jgi:hypothetical protein
MIVHAFHNVKDYKLHVQMKVRFLDNGEIVDYISLFKLSFDNVKEISLLHAE